MKPADWPKIEKAPRETKLQPSRTRSQETFELIVETARRLLEDVGVERLSTNLNGAPAGLSPPALYLYFPNNYAVLRELGECLMRPQDNAVFEWITQAGLAADDADGSLQKRIALQRESIKSPDGFWGTSLSCGPYGLFLPLAACAPPRVAKRMADALFEMDASVPRQRLNYMARMMTELGYAATEIVLEEPERDPEEITLEVCLMLGACFGAGGR